MTARALLSIAVVSLFLCSPAAAQEPGNPRLNVASTTHDFGVVPEGQTVRASFTLSNTGSGPLEIKKVVAACGCTVATLERQVLQPGENAALNVDFDTTGFQGAKVKTVRVYTNDSRAPSSLLTLKGTVREEVSVDPPRIYFGDVPKNSRSVKAINVVPNEPNVRITDINSRPDNVTISLSDTQEKGGKRISVGLKDTSQPGTIRGTLIVRTTSAKRPVITVPIFARVQSDLEIKPSYVSFDLLEGPLPKALTKHVEVWNRSSSNIQIEGVESDNKSVKGAVSVLKPGQRFDIAVSIAEGAVGTIRSRLSIKTDSPDPNEKTVVLPVYAIIARKGD